jgi:succinate dehydrogenase hydrophobic anchor subunit
MLGEWVLAGLGARSWGFDVEFLLLGFSGVVLFFFFFFFVYFMYA